MLLLATMVYEVLHCNVKLLKLSLETTILPSVVISYSKLLIFKCYGFLFLDRNASNLEDLRVGINTL